jgi:type I restriction enzyme S subunit
VSRWPRVRLDECCEIVSGATPSTSVAAYWDGDIPWATPKDLSDLASEYISDTPRKITRAGLESCAATILPTGSVLFSSRAPIGHVAVNTLPMATNQGFKSLIPRAERLDAKFLYWWLRANRGYLEGLGNGATFKEVSKAVVSRVEIPEPPLLEQRRIAEVLDRAEALRAKRRAALAQLDTMTQAIFFDLFGMEGQTPVTIGDKLHQHQMGWRWELLTDVARLATGHTPDRQRSDYWNGDIPWITLTEIRRLDGTTATETSEMVTQAGIDNSAAVRLPAGTVCFSRTASIGFVTVMGREMATSQDFVNWVCGPRLEPVYLMHALLLSRERLRALSTGSTHKTIYFPTVERFRVLVPPLHLQQSFARRLDRVEWLRSVHRASLADLDALFAALQYRAFRGEL